MKIKEIINLLKSNKNLIVILKSLGAIALITAVAVVSVHFLTGQTLTEYAEANPEIAYADHSDQTVNESADFNTDPDYNATAAGSTDSGSNATTTGTETNSSVSSNYNVATVDNAGSEANNASTDNTNASNSNSQAASEVNNTLSKDINISNQVHFYDLSIFEKGESSDSNTTIYKEGFYYQPLSQTVIDYITGCSMPTEIDNPVITTDDLSYLGILYRDFNGLTQAGEIICNKAIAQDLAEIFYELYTNDYQIEKVVLIDNYNGDDTASMSADNTSCFNYRVVANTTTISNHAYGLAIDINPFYNPYIVFGANEDGSDYISPSGSEIYADRSQNFAYKIDPDDLCYRLFKEHGFTWGGDWNSCKDYQHFQKTDSIK